jgi:hypothetical protein
MARKNIKSTIKVLTEAEIKALNGTPGPVMLSKMFPMGRR